MRIQRGGKIALFVGHDLIGLMITNQLVPELLKLGFVPMIINTGADRNTSPRVQPPALPAFFGAGIVDKVLLPHLDERPLQDPANTEIHRTYKQLAHMHNFEYHDVQNINDPEFLQKMQADPALTGGLAIRFLQIFNQDAINVLESKGFMWNLHGGILPGDRGLLVPFHAIARGDEEHGWTLHKMARRIDAGDIISKVSRPLDGLRAVFNAYADMVPYGVAMVKQALKEFLRDGEYSYTPQSPDEQKNNFTYPTEAEMDMFSRQGIHFIADAETHINTIVSTFCTDSHSPEGRELKAALIGGLKKWRHSLRQEGDPVPEKPLTQQAAGVQAKPSLLNAPQLANAA